MGATHSYVPFIEAEFIMRSLKRVDVDETET